jgi:hypothetical protein
MIVEGERDFFHFEFDLPDEDAYIEILYASATAGKPEAIIVVSGCYSESGEKIDHVDMAELMIRKSDFLLDCCRGRMEWEAAENEIYGDEDMDEITDEYESDALPDNVIHFIPKA